jgi:anti-sigma factor RsiW
MKITDKILSAWIDDGLSPKKMKAIRAAVQSDPELKARAEALRSVGAVLRDESFDMPVTAERMAADVRRAIRLQESPRSVWFPLWGWVGATACACLLVAAILVPVLRVDPAVIAQTEVEYLDSELPGSSPMVYTDQQSGWTIVWLDDAKLEPGI